MDSLAQRARLSRSSVHRLEHGSDVRTTPSKLAQVLAVLGIDADAVRAVLPDDDYRHDVLVWLEQAPRTDDLVATLEAARGSGAPDLVAIHSDGTVARIQAEGRTDELSEALKRAGWLVTRPT
jgi:transcriptional regulator with XRE-family HTH domain